MPDSPGALGMVVIWALGRRNIGALWGASEGRQESSVIECSYIYVYVYSQELMHSPMAPRIPFHYSTSPWSIGHSMRDDDAWKRWKLLGRGDDKLHFFEFKSIHLGIHASDNSKPLSNTSSVSIFEKNYHG